MRKLLVFTLSLLAAISVTGKTFAQSEEQRNKVQLAVVYGGKTIITDLNSLSMSISRSDFDEPVAPVITTDTGKTKSKSVSYPIGGFYLTMDAKQVSMELLKVFAKKQTRFDGMVTITDSYGKNAPRVVKFKQAALYSYSDSFSAASYGESYGSSAISIICKSIEINGVTIE